VIRSAMPRIAIVIDSQSRLPNNDLTVVEREEAISEKDR